MIKKTVDKLEEGMVIARDVCDDRGRLLIAKGTVLTAALTERLRSMTPGPVCVEGGQAGDDENGGGDGCGTRCAEIDERVREKFSPFKGVPAMERIAAAAARYLKGKIKNNGDE